MRFFHIFTATIIAIASSITPLISSTEEPHVLQEFEHMGLRFKPITQGDAEALHTHFFGCPKFMKH